MTSNSGVNLDEELTNLSSFQQAYSAGGARIPDRWSISFMPRCLQIQ